MRNGVDPTTGGRHAMSYIVNPDFAYYLCIFISKPGTLRTLVRNTHGEKVRDKDYPLKSLYVLVDTIDHVVEELVDEYPIKALAIGLPFGISKGRIAFCADFSDPSLKDFPLQEHLEAKFGIRTRVENDMNSMVVGCYNRMIREKNDSMVCVNVGRRGLGCGLYLRGHVIRGFHGFAGEMRHLPVSYDATFDSRLSSNGGATPVEIAQMVAAITCTVDPRVIVFYKHPGTEDVLEEVKDLCERFLPKDVIPELVISDHAQQDFEGGLIHFGKEMLMAGYELVNR